MLKWMNIRKVSFLSEYRWKREDPVEMGVKLVYLGGNTHEWRTGFYLVKEVKSVERDEK